MLPAHLSIGQARPPRTFARLEALTFDAAEQSPVPRAKFFQNPLVFSKKDVELSVFSTGDDFAEREATLEEIHDKLAQSISKWFILEPTYLDPFARATYGFQRRRKAMEAMLSMN